MTQPSAPPRWRDAPDAELSAEFMRGLVRSAEAGPSVAARARITSQLAQASAAARSGLALVKGAAALLTVVGVVAVTLWALEGRVAPPAAGGAAEHPAAPARQAAAPPPTAPSVAVEPSPAPVPMPAAPEARPRRSPRVAPSAPASSPAAELALLVPARKLVAVDPARALTLIEQHRSEHARGAFAEEREVLAVESLLRLGRTQAARTRAEGFARAYPASVQRERLERLFDHAL